MMKPRLLSERGQALIMIAFAAIGLFLIAGLAIDGSHKYSDRRHAQNAADTAAVAGALEQAKGLAAGKTQSVCKSDPSWSNSPFCTDIINAAWTRATENGYDGMLNSNVEVYSPPLTGIYSNCGDVHFDCKDYVEVVITSTRETWFMRLIGIDSFTNTVYAWASTITDDDYFNIGGSAVVALSPDGCAIKNTGTADIKIIGGGLYSNSDDACAFQSTTCSGTTQIYTDPAGTILGDINYIGGAQVNSSPSCQPIANRSQAGTTQLPFPPPYEEIAAPAVCSDPVINIAGNPNPATLSPGHYSAMPPKPSMKDYTLQPGVYCIDTEIRAGSTDTFSVAGTFGTGPGVFLYIKPGGSFTFNGGSTVNIWGIHDPTSPYNGYLIYAAPDYSTGTPATCTINGGSLSNFQGTIYAPYCDVTLNGGGSPTGFQSQVIAYTVKFAGNSPIYLTYDASNSPFHTIPVQVGLAK